MKLIYFIKDTRGGEVMIGVATKGGLDKRIQALQQGNPAELKLLGVIKTRNATAIARELRATYAGSHVRGPWFDPAPDLLKFIRSHAVIP